MKILEKINVLRKKITKSFTKNIGKSSSDTINFNTIKADKISNVLIVRPNHRLGNMLLITPLVQEVATIFPNAKIDLFVKGKVAHIVFQNNSRVRRIISLPKKHFKQIFKYVFAWIQLKSVKYDLVINCVEYSSSGKLATRIANAKYKYYGDFLTYESKTAVTTDSKHAAKSAVIGIRKYFKQNNSKDGEIIVPTLNLFLNEVELSEGKSILKNITKNEKKTIAIFTHATGAKSYSVSWWQEFYATLKFYFPDHNIIEILPIENTSKIKFLAPTYYSTDIRLIASIIANTELFIGADSGMMHLASAAQTTTVGLFSVTDQEIYKPYGNNSIAINTKESDISACIQMIKNLLH